MSGERNFGMDWLRIGAFALLILYHIGLVFSPWEFELKSDRTADWVAVPLLLSNAWRLSLLFLISGYASASLFAKDGARVGRFARSRLARLGIPLLFAMLVLNTPQPWIALVTQHGYPHGLGYYLEHDYYTFREIDGIATPTWMHLWFVAYLLAYTLVLALLLAVIPPGVRASLQRGAERLLAGPLLLILPTVWIFLARLLPPGWSDSHALVDDLSAHAVYFPMVLTGWLLRRSPDLMAAVLRQWKVAALLAAASFVAVTVFELRYPGDTVLPEAYLMPYRAVRAMQCWSAIVALIGIANTFWNRDNRWRALLAEAIFPFYIIHQTVILVAGYPMLGWHLPMGLQFLWLVAATVAGCWAFYLTGRQVGPLRPLIGLKR